MELKSPVKAIIAENLLSQHVSGECVILDMNTEKYFGLDAIGARIWEIISEDGDIPKAFERLLTEYNIDESTLKQDFLNLLTALEKEKLVVLES